MLRKEIGDNRYYVVISLTLKVSLGFFIKSGCTLLKIPVKGLYISAHTSVVCAVKYQINYLCCLGQWDFVIVLLYMSFLGLYPFILIRYFLGDTLTHVF